MASFRIPANYYLRICVLAFIHIKKMKLKKDINTDRFLKPECLMISFPFLQGFYLGDRIKVVTKRDDCPYVTEITISKVSYLSYFFCNFPMTSHLNN